MSRWFRHYGGMMRDEKLVRVAVAAAQPIERIMWVWSALLESASEVNDGGRYDFDAGEAAYFLRCEPGDVHRILDGLVASGRVAKGVVIRWGDRQFDSDTSRERQRRYRERRNADGNQSTGSRSGDDGETSRDGEVTVQEDREQIADTPSLRSGERAREKRKSRIDETWSPNAKNLEYARTHGLSPLDISLEHEKFRDHHLKKGDAFVDWDAAWRTWCQRVRDFRTTRPSGGTGPPQRKSAATSFLDDLQRMQSESDERANTDNILDLRASRAS